MRDSQDPTDNVLRHQADPRNRASAPGPYSGTGVDYGPRARKALNKAGTVGGLVFLIADIQKATMTEMAGRSKIHPGRFADIVNGEADPLSDERQRIAIGLGIPEDELP